MPATPRTSPNNKNKLTFCPAEWHCLVFPCRAQDTVSLAAIRPQDRRLWVT